MPRNNKRSARRPRRDILARVTLPAAYDREDDDRGTDQDDDRDDRDTADDEHDDGTVSLTEEQLNQRIGDAVAEALKKDRLRRKKKKAAAAPKEEEEPAEEPSEEEEEASRSEAARLADAEQRATMAERKALLADVNVQLRDYMGTRHPEFVAHAIDIMPHIEKALSDEPKPGEVNRLIEAHSKAFIDRLKGSRGGTHGAPVGGTRGKMPAATPNPTGTPAPTNPPEHKGAPNNGAPRFSTINWHG